MARVLVVEDDHDLAHTVREVLEFDGHEVTSVLKSDTAAAVAAECAPDVILLDIMMEPLDGFEVAAQLRAEKQTAAIPIVVMTARPTAEGCAEKIGTPHYLAKPFYIDDLLECVQRLTVHAS